MNWRLGYFANEGCEKLDGVYVIWEEINRHKTAIDLGCDREAPM